MDNYYLRILTGIMAIALIAAIFFLTTQLSSLNETQTSLDGAEVQLTNSMQLFEAMEIEATEALEEASGFATQLSESSTESAEMLATSDANATQFAEDAGATSTENSFALERANDAATEALDAANATATQSAEDASATLESVGQMATRAASEATEELAILQSTVGAVGDIIADEEAQREELEFALTESAATIEAQATELADAQNSLDEIATTIAEISSIGIVEITPEVEMTEEAGMTPEVTAEAESTEEADSGD